MFIDRIPKARGCSYQNRFRWGIQWVGARDGKRWAAGVGARGGKGGGGAGGGRGGGGREGLMFLNDQAAMDRD